MDIWLPRAQPGPRPRGAPGSQGWHPPCTRGPRAWSQPLVSQAGGAHQARPGNKAVTTGHRPATVGAVPAPAGTHLSYRGAWGCGRTRGQSGGLASAPAHRPQSLPESPSGLPVYGRRAGPRKRYLPRGRYLAGRPLRFSRPFFLSVSTVTRAGRKLARVSDNCAKGSRKRADGKQVSTGGSSRRPPASDSSLPAGRRARCTGRGGLGGPRGFLTDSGEKTQAPRVGQRKHASGLRPPDVMGTTGSPQPPGGQGRLRTPRAPPRGAAPWPTPRGPVVWPFSF